MKRESILKRIEALEMVTTSREDGAWFDGVLAAIKDAVENGTPDERRVLRVIVPDRSSIKERMT